MTRTEKRKQETMLKLINAAMEVFGEYGYINATVSEIAERADVGYGTFYQYFKNKKELLLYLSEEICDHISDHAYLKSHKGLSLRKRLYYGVVEILSFYDQYSAALKALNEAESSDKSFSSCRERIYLNLYERVSHDINYFIKKGYCRTVVDDTIITALTCMIDGYAGKMIHEPESGSGVNIEKIAESLTEVSYRVLFNDDFEDATARK